MRARRKSRTKLISFSGIDGSGKSTQIQILCTRMMEMGLRVQVIQFWDAVATFTRFREVASHTLFKSEKGIGTSSAPVRRRDKNVRSWPMTGVRLCLYLADAVSASFVVKRALHSGNDVAIFDRYIYDQLANLNLKNPFMRAYAGLIMNFVPRPDISYLLDADPLQARARKPEYPLDFLYICRASYMALCAVIGGITVIPAMPVQSVEQEVLKHALNALSCPGAQSRKASNMEALENLAEKARMDESYTRPSAF